MGVSMCPEKNKSIKLENINDHQLIPLLCELIDENSEQPDINSILIKDCKLEEKEYNHLVTMISKCNLLNSVALTHNKLDSEHLINLLKSINKECINSITISDHWINDVEFENMAGVIASYNNLNSLELSLDWLHDLGISTLMNALDKLNISRLNISCNDFHLNGLIAVANYLKTHAIKEIDLSYNWIDSSSIAHISASLCKNKHLNILDLKSNQIKDEGANHLAKALLDNHHLGQLDVSDNQITTKGAISLINSALEHHNLKHMNLSHNDISPESALDLKKLNTSDRLHIIF